MTENNTIKYEDKVKRLDEILERLDNSETPIDELAKDVEEGAKLIKECKETLEKVEVKVMDAFKLLEDEKEQNNIDVI